MDRAPKFTNSKILTEISGGGDEAEREEIIRNSKTLNLPEEDQKTLARFVEAFIKSAVKQFSKAPQRTFLESFAVACLAFSGCGVAIVTDSSSALEEDNGNGPGIVPLVNVASRVTRSAVSSILDKKRAVDNLRAVKNVKDFLIQDDKENTDPVEMIFRQFLAQISTDIFLRYMEQIRQWTSTQGYIYIDEIGDVFGQRCCHKLKQIDLKKGDTYDNIVQKFIKNEPNIGKIIENWFLETTKFKVEDYRSIFHDPIPALYVKGQLKVKRPVTANAAQIKNEIIAPKWLVEKDKILFEQLRPPFHFEQRDMEANEKDLLTVNVKTTVTNISIEKFVWEDPTPLASKIGKKIEVDLNPFKKIRVEAEMHKEEVLEAQRKTQVGVDELLLIQKRRDDCIKIKPKSSAANPVPYFTGRADLLKEIHKKLDKCFANNSGKLAEKIVFLVGSEGYGKTETAKMYAKTHLKEYYTNIIWIDAGSFESLKRSFEKTEREWGIDLHRAAKVPDNNKSFDFDADQKRVTELCQIVYQYFTNVGSKQNSLFIFDNAQQQQMTDVGVGNTAKRNRFGIGIFLPQQQGAYLPVFLVTSNNCNWGSSAQMENIVRIEKLPQCDTLSILNARFDIQKEDGKHPGYKELQDSMKELANILDGFPLALSIVAASVVANVEEDQ